MPEGFFSRAELPMAGGGKPSRVPECGPCGLYKGCRSPKMAVTGDGRKGVLVVGEAPGEVEDERGEPFVGPAGQRLRRTLTAIGVDLFRDCWVTNSLACFLGETLVQSPTKINKVYSRNYSGSLTTINTESGRKLTGTPNHPILTPSGWVALGLLKEGDYLICRSDGKGTSLSGADIDYPPIPIKEVADSLSKLGHVERMVGRSMNFHGDGEDGYVEIIRADRELRGWIKPSPHKHLNQPNFIAAGVSPSDCQRFGPSQLNPLDCLGGVLTSSPSVVGGACDFRPLVLSHQGPTESQGLGLAPGRNSEVLKNPLEFTVRDAQRLGEGLKTFPTNVTLDRVVKIEVKTFDNLSHGNDGSNGAGHVYNLETEGGYYFAAGIIVSNCRPKDNRTPTDKEIGYCRPNVSNAVLDLKPSVIVLLGGSALQSVVGWLWGEEPGGVTRWAGFRSPAQEVNAWVCPTYHPSYVLREEDEALDRIFAKHLRAAFALAGRRPWKKPPDYAKRVVVCLDSDEASARIETLTRSSDLLAFDYETNCLKPDDPESEIVCCSLSDGKTSVTFPWRGRPVELMKELYQSEVKKVAANLKFEDRWTRAKLGVEINNWYWDTMVAAHVLDNRGGVSGLKFQAFARLGQKDYDGHVKEYLRSREGGGYGLNRVRKCPLKDLLLYCGMDSLLELLLAKVQMKELGA